jgi:hypothetical protein
MPRRYLAPAISRDQLFADIASQEPRAALFYLMALPHAGDDCALPTNAPSELRLLVCPGVERVTPGDVAEWLRLLTAASDHDSHALLEYGEDGRLRFPPHAFYRYQTYIPPPKRSALEPECIVASINSAPASAKNAEISEKLRRQEKNAEISEKSLARARPSVTPSPSPSPSPSTTPPAATQPTEWAPSQAPDASRPNQPAAPLALLVPDALVLGEQSEEPPARATGTEPDEEPPSVTALRPGPSDAPEAMTRPGPLHAPIEVPKPKGHPFGELWDAFDAVFGEARTRTEQSRRGRACKEARESHVSGDELLLAAQHWPNVMGDATMTEFGIVANLGKLLHGPQVDGRSNGTVTAHTQRLTETALVPHQATVADIRRRRKGNDEPGR